MIDLMKIWAWDGGGYSYNPPPDIPSESSPEMTAAAEEAAKKEADLQRKKKGRRSTILTGGQGITDKPSLSSGTLLGQGTKANLGE